MGRENIKAFRAQSYIFKRYIWLLSVLYDYKRLSFQEISDKWAHSSLNDDNGAALPKRTFHDHINAVQEIFGITIRNENKGDYKYYIENNDEIKCNTLHAWMLDNFSLSNALADAKEMSDRIFIQAIPSSKRWLSTIIEAIKNKQILLVEYTSYQKGKIPTLQLCPFFVKLYDNRWYVYAREADCDVMKHYALDRINDIKVSEEKFTFEPSTADRDNLEHCFGHSIYPDIKPETIYLKATTAAALYLDSLPLHNSQKKIEEGEGYAIYSYFFAPTPDFKTALRKWKGRLIHLSEYRNNNL